MVITDSAGRIYMKNEALSVAVSSPKALTSFAFIQSNNTVGESQTIFLEGNLAAPLLPNSIIELTTSAGINLSGATLPAATITIVFKSASQLRVQGFIVSGNKFTIVVQNVRNNVQIALRRTARSKPRSSSGSMTRK
jgi:hypothetical protein